MARNEEKQQGRLNRLWLQREREEGRLRDVNERRPRLSALTSASSVKKWIPSIKSEIEYYLQQSQLTHYPERKIAQFQLHIQALEADPLDGPSTVKFPHLCGSHDGSTDRRDEGEPDCKTGSEKAPGPDRAYMSQTESVPETSEGVCADQDQNQNQDQPLSFDHTRLAVAVAAFRGPVSQLGSSQTHSLARVLQSRLPNLTNSSSSSSSSLSRDLENKGCTLGSIMEQRSQVQVGQTDCGPAEMNSGKTSIDETSEERGTHILGLDCYSSSTDDDEEEEEDS
ncbi:uncharacterized protein si:dkey-86e18.1 isoform X1 [Xyrichtys novacula]|uniref:Uncharacterized protein si:dkey-86e18.1 isoform X1 n=1 Tax=Xyrichtys novacula TaxID=13765 RepID=A0AAV1FGN3_XYRNO|nr:uncharacterized protein si:dkey-86e18.1 isoform X1 [Xyrichtys novacula]